MPVMGIHTHVLDNIPEDTDVFHVLRKETPVPEMIVTEASVFTVGADGEIKYDGRREDVFKRAGVTEVHPADSSRHLPGCASPGSCIAARSTLQSE